MAPIDSERNSDTDRALESDDVKTLSQGEIDKLNTSDQQKLANDPESNHSRDQSTRVMPKVLVLIAALLLCGRITDIGVQVARSAAPQPVHQAIQWHDLPELTAGAFKTKQEFVPPPVLDVSPETTKEIEKVLAQSREQNKHVIYEFYSPDSDPCRKMESTSLTNVQVSKLIEQHLMPFRVTDRLKQLGKNPRLVTDLQKKFRIFAFPTLVIVDEKGETAATLVGNCSSLTTYRFLSRAIHSLDERSKTRHDTGEVPHVSATAGGMSGIVAGTTPPAYPTLALKSPKG